jgi:DNA polymerase III delta prime subunit
MKDIKVKQSILAAIQKMCDEQELSPLAEMDKKKKSAMIVEVEPEQAELEGDQEPMSMSDKIDALRDKSSGIEDKPKSEDLDDDMKAKLLELYAKLK